MIANLSIDLDNKWAYLKTAQSAGWESYPSYLDQVAPRIVRVLSLAEIQATIFVVGRDLENQHDRAAIATLAQAGHRLANHSYEHEPWLHVFEPDRVRYEIEKTHEQIVGCGGVAPKGFRGPGFSDSEVVHRILREMEYDYCASSFPSCVGPLARAYYLLKTRLRKDPEKAQMFGAWSNMFKSNRPYRIQQGAGTGLWMFPVTVQPMTRLPFHFTYLFFLCQKSVGLARMYYRLSLQLCRLGRVTPSLLLHPLDFVGEDEHPDLAFFPGMKLRSEAKAKQLEWFLTYLKKRFDVMSMEQHLHQLQSEEPSR